MNLLIFFLLFIFFFKKDKLRLYDTYLETHSRVSKYE